MVASLHVSGVDQLGMSLVAVDGQDVLDSVENHDRCQLREPAHHAGSIAEDHPLGHDAYSGEAGQVLMPVKVESPHRLWVNAGR